MLQNKMLFILTLALLAGCNSGGGGAGGGFKFADDPVAGKAICSLTTKSPNLDSLKVSALSGTVKQFTVGTSVADCPVIFSLNDVELSGVSPVLALDSSQLNAGTNTLKVVVGSTSHTWTINKNAAPVCSNRIPNSSNQVTSPGSNLIFTGSGTDADQDPLKFVWKINGQAAPTNILSTFDGVTSSQASFTPDVSFIGANSVTMTISDGIDATDCAWSAGVAGSCSIAATNPSAPSVVKVPFLATSIQNFQATAGVGCGISWKLNGVPVVGAVSATLAVASQTLLTGANILEVSVTNGSSIDSKAWTVLRNTPPTCSVQTPPVNSPVTVGVGGSTNLLATGADANADTLTFNWKNNGQPVDPIYFAITPGTNTSAALFSPSNAYVGSNNVKAEISDGYDISQCSWDVSVAPTCSIVSAFPATSTYKYSSVASAQQTFLALANDPGCAVTWKLNNNSLGAAASSEILTSSQLLDGPTTNTLVATASNGSSSSTRTWTLLKNQNPTCGTIAPAATGSRIGVGGNITLTSQSVNPDADITSFNWLINGAAANPTYFATSVTGNNVQSVFSPNVSFVGANNINLTINDGYDLAQCNWSVGVVNSCAISSSFPSTSTLKVANLANTINSFGVVPSDSVNCTIAWTLNNNPVVGSSFVSVLSSDLANAPGTNSLVATLDNGVTAPVNRSWTITKNKVPVCSTQTPVSNPAPMPYGTTSAFASTGFDYDGDTLSSFIWKFNGSPSGSVFNPVTVNTPSTNAQFNPSISQVGNGQTITANFTDGYDPGSCTWNVDIINPNKVQVVSCSPNTNPIILTSSGIESSKTLTTTANNASTYEWLKNGAIQNGFTTAQLNVSSSSLPVGSYSFKNTVRDSFNGSDFCDYNVKVNGPPVLSNLTPMTSITPAIHKVNFGSTLSFSLTATDANSDPLSYAWTLDGAASATLPSGSSATTFSPNSNSSLLGSHTITVTVSDGAESTSASWTVEVNLFNQACNLLLNQPVDLFGAAARGKICTFVGVPGMGSGLTPSADQTLIRIKPNNVTDDGSGNWYFTDVLNHSVGFFNRSASPITRFNKTVAAGKLGVIIGNGAQGITQDSVLNNQFKLNTPQGLAYDSVGARLYVADYANNRVAVIDNAGLATTFFGKNDGTANANALANNTDGTTSLSTQLCNSPTDVKVVADPVPANGRWLYISCYASHVIKRVQIESTHADYGKAYIVVGRLTGGATSAGNEDGDLGSTGYARVNGPWALDADNNGNIYWTEYLGFRLRMATMGGALTTFFNGASIAANAIALNVNDLAGTFTSASALTVNARSTGVVGPYKIIVSGTPTSLTNSCVPLRISTLDNNNDMYQTGVSRVVSLAATSGLFYSNATCSANVSSVNISSTDSEVDLYFKNTAASVSTITASLAGYTSGTLTHTTASSGVANRVYIYGPNFLSVDSCTPLNIVAGDSTLSNKASNVLTPKVIKLWNNTSGTYYSTSNCSGTPISSVTINAGQSNALAYYSRSVVAAPFSVASIAGTNVTNSANYLGVTGVGTATLRQPRGLAVWSSGSTVRGIFVSNYDQNRDLYINNEGITRNMGGLTIGPAQAGMVLGTGVCGYNADGLGSTSRVCTSYGRSISSTNNSLLVADFDNFRLRTFDIASNNGQIQTEVGVGRARSGNLGDSQIAASLMTLNFPSQLIVDSPAKKMYISDTGSSRIRRVDLLTGYVDTLIGKNINGAATTENEDPTNTSLFTPKGLTSMTVAGAKFLVYADSGSDANNSNNLGPYLGVNRNCQVRAMNMTPNISSPPPATLLGISINASKVSTLIGDYVLGCQSWYTATSNGASAVGIDSKISSPEGLSNDGTNLYTAQYGDHCVVKTDATGVMTPILGLCGTAGNVEGTTLNARITNPTAVMVDTQYAGDGNFFVADMPGSNPARVRYVNFRNTSVDIGSTTIPAATSPNGYLQTVWTVNVTGSSGQIFGMATFANQFCIASGSPTSGTVGAHNVTCYDRSSNLGPITLRVGPNELSSPPIRAGAPLDNASQEGVAAGSAQLNTPYGLAFDADGNLYITERNNHLVRMVRRWF